MIDILPLALFTLLLGAEMIWVYKQGYNNGYDKAKAEKNGKED